MKLIECVPNFSEGRDMAVLEKIAAAIKEVNGVTLLDMDPGADTNRTVFTFIGSPDGIREAAFRAIKKGSELIDMTKHSGAHARMGATDVCPFIPVSGVTMEECVKISEEVGERVARELHIPVYLYEYSAKCEERTNLANIREGEYEGLSEKLKDPRWKPDFGEAVFNPGSGATVMGAREFLIAYNINLNTTDAKMAKSIANTIREKGKVKRDAAGKIVKDSEGNKVMEPGLFNHCKATGWYIDQYKQAQVTMNLTNYKVTPPHLVFDAVCDLASKMGLRVTGSELVGLIPLEAMLMAGTYYLEKQGKSAGIPDSDIIRTAIQSLGLEDISPFEPKKKIIEYYISDRPDALTEMTIKGFCDELSTDSPAPGGGSVAALCGALSAALSAMVSNLTYGKKGYTQHNKTMDEIGRKGQELKKEFVYAIDKDTDAFNELMAVIKTKAKTPEEEAEKAARLEEATKKATLVPMETLELTIGAMEIALTAAKLGNKNSVSDAGVAALCAQAAAKSAYYNVVINLQNISDESFKKEIGAKAEEILAKAYKMSDEVQTAVDVVLGIKQTAGIA
ncbi:MAG: glutamate formimidoyltransferase [Firmicutes bacterium]|nr:glutamate formimidoyltransferase [Bacillota bacterium]